MDSWKLGDLFASQEALEERVQSLKAQAQEFESQYKGKLSTCPQGILQKYEAILEGIGSIGTYTFLLFAQDSSRGDVYANYELKSKWL